MNCNQMQYPRFDFSRKVFNRPRVTSNRKTKLYNVFVLFQNHKMPSKYVAGLVKLRRNTKASVFESITLTPSLKDNYSFSQALEAYMFIKKAMDGGLAEKDGSKFKIDFVLSEFPERFKDLPHILTSPFRIKKDMEDELIRIYTGWFYKIRQGQSKLPIQELKLNNGLVLEENQSGTRLKIDYDTIRPHTFAVMFAMYYVIKDNVMDILERLET